MKVIKFTINENYYEEFKDICISEDITIKKKINSLLSSDVRRVDINEYFPIDHDKNMRKVTLKINEELYKGIMKNCGRFDFKASRYVAYLIYKFLLKKK